MSLLLLVLFMLVVLVRSVLVREWRLVLRESLDWVREAGRWGGGALFRLEREWVEELALGLRVGSEGAFKVVGSGRRWERWFVKRFRRTEEVDVMLGAGGLEEGAMGGMKGMDG
jgi:hypothetical protein